MKSKNLKENAEALNIPMEQFNKMSRADKRKALKQVLKKAKKIKENKTEALQSRGLNYKKLKEVCI